MSTLGFDAGEKLRVYARHAVPGVWIVDVSGREVVVHSTPDPDQGIYTHIETLTQGSLGRARLEVEVQDL